MTAYDLIQIGFPVPVVGSPEEAARWVCNPCIRQRRQPGPEIPIIDRRRINPDGDIWALPGDGMLVSDRVRALLAICCPDQMVFAPVSDCTRPDSVIPGFYVGRPVSELGPADAPCGEAACDCCGQPIPLHDATSTRRAAWNGLDIISTPLLRGPTRRYLASYRLVLLFKKAGVRGVSQFHHPILLAGDGPTHEDPVSWAESGCASIPTERTFRAPPPDEAWHEQFLARLGAGQVGVHPRALMAWQHGNGIPLPPSFRSLLFTRDGFEFEMQGRTRTGRVGLTGRARVASLAELGKPSLRLEEWQVPADNDADKRWDALTFAWQEDGTLWAFDLSRPTNRGEYPVFRYDPQVRQPVEFFDHFVDWLQECCPEE